MTTDELKARLSLAQQSIHKEILKLSEDLGAGWEIEMDLRWVEFYSLDSGESFPPKPTVRLGAKLVR